MNTTIEQDRLGRIKLTVPSGPTITLPPQPESLEILNIWNNLKAKNPADADSFAMGVYLGFKLGSK